MYGLFSAQRGRAVSCVFGEAGGCSPAVARGGAGAGTGVWACHGRDTNTAKKGVWACHSRDTNTAKKASCTRTPHMCVLMVVERQPLTQTLNLTLTPDWTRPTTLAGGRQPARPAAAPFPPRMVPPIFLTLTLTPTLTLAGVRQPARPAAVPLPPAHGLERGDGKGKVRARMCMHAVYIHIICNIVCNETTPLPCMLPALGTKPLSSTATPAPAAAWCALSSATQHASHAPRALSMLRVQPAPPLRLLNPLSEAFYQPCRNAVQNRIPIPIRFSLAVTLTLALHVYSRWPCFIQCTHDGPTPL